MKLRKRVMLVFSLFAFVIQARADSWLDPKWKEMIDSSHVIALVQYTSKGNFRASAKVLKVYKGKLKAGDKIYISGFSNRYGPIDKMHRGDRYLVFLRLNKPTSGQLEYWNEELEKKPGLKKFVDALKERRAYYVRTPTSGDLKVKGNRIQYDLVQTTYYRNQNLYSLNEFEDFLMACQHKNVSLEWGRKLVSKIKPANESNLNAQYLMQLYLAGYGEFDPVFEAYVNVNNPSSKYALAMLMGNIRTERSRNVLIDLLNDKHTIVQGEVVRQLKNEPAPIVAPPCRASSPHRDDAI